MIQAEFTNHYQADNEANSNSSSDEGSENYSYSTQELELISLSSSAVAPTNLITKLNRMSLPIANRLKFWNKRSFQVNHYDPTFKVVYLGNLGVQLWSRDLESLAQPLDILWSNYLNNMKTEIVMRLTICNSGLKSVTRQHGLTQYWSNRLVYCGTHPNHTGIFCWIYRHEAKKMRQELRCHAVFCNSQKKASKMAEMLNERLSYALQEFRREKRSRCFSLPINDVSSLSSSSSLSHNKLHLAKPLRRQILEKGSAYFRLPLDRSKSAPKLSSIIEEQDEDIDSGYDAIECDDNDSGEALSHVSDSSDQEINTIATSNEVETSSNCVLIESDRHPKGQTSTECSKCRLNDDSVDVSTIDSLLSNLMILPPIENTETSEASTSESEVRPSNPIDKIQPNRQRE